MASNKDVANVTDKIQHYASVQTKPKLVEHNNRDEQKKVYAINEGHALVLVTRVVVGFVLVFEAGALVVALAALTAAALAAGFLASAFLLESFFGFAAVATFFAGVVFFVEALEVVAFLTAGLGATFALGFLGAPALFGFSAVLLDVFNFSAAGFFTTFAADFLGLSLVEGGFLAVVVVFLAEAGFVFSFVVLDGPLYNLTFPDFPFGRVNISPSPLAMARLRCAMFAAVGSRP